MHASLFSNSSSLQSLFLVPWILSKKKKAVYYSFGILRLTETTFLSLAKWKSENLTIQ